MHGDKPMGEGKTEPVKLQATVSALLEECRMVLPGIQALFGFQLIAIFSQGFDEKLTASQQQIHFAALFLIAVSAAVIMTPAAVHRQTQQRTISERFVWLSSKLLLLSMVPLAMGLTLDVYLIGCAIFDSFALAAMSALMLVVLLFVLWFAIPRRERLKAGKMHLPD